MPLHELKEVRLLGNHALLQLEQVLHVRLLGRSAPLQLAVPILQLEVFLLDLLHEVEGGLRLLVRRAVGLLLRARPLTPATLRLDPPLRGRFALLHDAQLEGALHLRHDDDVVEALDVGEGELAAQLGGIFSELNGVLHFLVAQLDRGELARDSTPDT